MVLVDNSFEKRSSTNNKIDKKFGRILQNHIDKPEEIIQNILLYIKRYKLTRLLTWYELFKHTINLPGDIIDLGIFRGESILSFARFLECFSMGERVKKIFGFDHFKGLQNFKKEDGNNFESVDKKKGGWCGINYKKELYNLINLFDENRFMPAKKRVEIIEGDVIKTIPKFVKDNPGIRISLLHFDLDLYEPTKIGLKYLYDKVVIGGVIIFDEYAFHQFSGETKAVDEFFKEHNIKTKLKTFEWFSNPGAYIIKDEY